MTQRKKTLSSRERIKHRRSAISSFKAKADARRTSGEIFADWLTEQMGTVPFLLINALWFIVWLAINVGAIPGIEPFDPYPFNLLTMAVSLEAIFLAIIVLISQNRAAKIADIREEIDLQINAIAEAEITKVIKLLALSLEKQGVKLTRDPDYREMIKPISSTELEKTLSEQLSKKS